MMKKSVLTIFGLALLFGIGGCRRQAKSGSRNFSFDFDSDKKEDLVIAARMYDSLCDELKSRDFKQLQTTTDSEKKSARYEGKYEGFSLTVEIYYLLSVSQDGPEFYYRVSFDETSEVDRLDRAAKELRVLMERWSSDKK
jgi:hypothetical protein